VDCARRVNSCQHSIRCFMWVHPLLHLPLVERIVVCGSCAIVAPLHVSHGWISTNSDSAQTVLAFGAVDARVLELLHLLLLEELSLLKLLYLLYRWKL
jgi:hypothetical protein